MRKPIVLVLLCAAILAVGCTRTAPAPQTDIPEGLHLLADAELYVDRSGPSQVKVSYLANVVNAGTVACTEYRLTISAWPDTLRLLRDSTWGWDDTTGKPFNPGDRYRPYGEAVFDLSGLSAEQLAQALTGMTVTLRCLAPQQYRNQVVFTVHRGSPPPLFAPK